MSYFWAIIKETLIQLSDNILFSFIKLVTYLIGHIFTLSKLTGFLRRTLQEIKELKFKNNKQ